MDIGDYLARGGRLHIAATPDALDPTGDIVIPEDQKQKVRDLFARLAHPAGTGWDDEDGAA